MKSKYLEHEKLQAVKNPLQEIGQFLEWLRGEENMFLGKEVDPCEECDRYIEEERFNIESLLAQYFEIDLEVIEQEKQQMLKDLQNG